MSSPPARTPRRRGADALLTTDPTQRLRLVQAGLAMLLMVCCVAILVYAARVGGTGTAPVVVWATLSLGGMAAFFAAIRSGWSARFKDPALTPAQMSFAIVSCAVAYAMAGPLRGASLAALLVVLMFGMFQLRPRVVAGVGLYAVLVFGTVMALMAWRRPQVFAPAVELGHFLMLGGIAAGGGRAGRPPGADARTQPSPAPRTGRSAGADPGAGHARRTHRPDQPPAHARAARTGTPALCALGAHLLPGADRRRHFKQVNDCYGHAAGDKVLRRLALDAQGAIRAADVLARWGGEEFVLLLADARLPLARGGVERLRQRVEASTLLAADPTLHVTVSAGLTEHIAGEAVSDALARADRALYEAKAEGRNRTVMVDSAGRVP